MYANSSESIASTNDTDHISAQESNESIASDIVSIISFSLPVLLLQNTYRLVLNYLRHRPALLICHIQAMIPTLAHVQVMTLTVLMKAMLASHILPATVWGVKWYVHSIFANASMTLGYAG